jgi:hypothetical protein
MVTHTPASKVTSLLPLLRSGFRLPTAGFSNRPSWLSYSNSKRLCFTHFTFATLAQDSRLTQASSGSGYFATDDHSASLSWYLAPNQICITVGHLQSSYCGAPSLTRGWVCNLLLKSAVTIWCQVPQKSWPHLTESLVKSSSWTLSLVTPRHGHRRKHICVAVCCRSSKSTLACETVSQYGCRIFACLAVVA